MLFYPKNENLEQTQRELEMCLKDTDALDTDAQTFPPNLSPTDRQMDRQTDRTREKSKSPS